MNSCIFSSFLFCGGRNLLNLAEKIAKASCSSASPVTETKSDLSEVKKKSAAQRRRKSREQGGGASRTRREKKVKASHEGLGGREKGAAPGGCLRDIVGSRELYWIFCFFFSKQRMTALLGVGVTVPFYHRNSPPLDP